jgi:hypothetical protein
MSLPVRKIVTLCEATRLEMGQAVTPPARRAVAAAILANPCAGRFHADLSLLTDMAAELGDLLTRRALAALGVEASAIQSFGKAAMIGENGELEHAAALLHPSLGAPMRAVLGGGKALVPSAKKMGGPGQSLDIPLGHKDAAYVRSHFDAMEIRVAGAPQADEVLIAIALSPGGRPNPRVGGLVHEEIRGDDGLR